MTQTVARTAHVTGTIDGPVYRITLNQPDKRNAVSFRAWQEIPRFISEAEQAPEVRVIVLRGAGDDAFSAGADISEFPHLRFEPEQATKYNDAHNGAEAAVLECSKPTIAMVNGWCVGGGLQLALGCDIRLGTVQSRFGITPAKLGVVIGHQTTTRMETELGPAWTKLLLYTGRIINAEEALRINLIQEVGTEQHIDNRLEQLLQEIISGEPLAQFATKQFALRNVQTRTEDARERNLARESFSNKRYQEAVQDFLVKQRTDFSAYHAHPGK